jgi:hypothetical protein
MRLIYSQTAPNVVEDTLLQSVELVARQKSKQRTSVIVPEVSVRYIRLACCIHPLYRSRRCCQQLWISTESTT